MFHMLVVKIELWPRGDRTKSREIGRTYIANVSGGGKRADYEVAVCRKGSNKCPLVPNRPAIKAARRGEVKDYPRLSYNVWRLVIRALKSAFPEEK